MRDLYNHVTSTFLSGINDVYDDGGIKWVDSLGQLWHFVPVVAFVATDMDEAKWMKGLYKGFNANMPCHLCEVTFQECGNYIAVEDIQYRSAKAITKLIKRHAKALREEVKEDIASTRAALKERSAHPVLNPYLNAPLGDVGNRGYFSVVWPEVQHQMEGGMMKRSIELVVGMMEERGKGEKQYA